MYRHFFTINELVIYNLFEVLKKIFIIVKYKNKSIIVTYDTYKVIK